MIIASTATQLPARTQRTRAVVMTMGALHEGHLSLVRRARELADQVVVTIFVNPLQFNDASDLENYPRTFEADCDLLEREGVDAVFAPTRHEMYGDADPHVTVSAGPIGEVFEGEHRPGHFDGMLTVVLKLMHLTSPDVALFGAKDAQQVIAVRAMVRDLSVPVDIVTVPTVRDEDGLALSSRNVHLSPSERQNSLVLYRALTAAQQAARNGASAVNVIQAGQSILDHAHHSEIKVEYLDALDPDSSQAVPEDYRGDAVIAVAAYVGGTRLIDNVNVRIGPDQKGVTS